MKKHWLRHAWPYGLACLACAPSVNAQESLRAAIDGYQVLSITLTNVGPENVSEGLVKSQMRVKVGDAYNPNAIDDDVQNLLKTGYFFNVQVAEVREPKGVNLTYVLQARPRLTDITFTGNKKYSNSRLQKTIASKVGDPLDERKLFADVQAVQKKYQKAGRHKTEVKYVTNIDPKTGRGSVTFEIIETPKVIITDVTFEGASAFTQRKLRKQIKTRRHWWLSWITGSGVLKDDQLEDDKEKLLEFYRDAGYIDFDLKEVKYDYANPKRVKLNFQITEGQQYKVGQISFEGNKLYNTNELSGALKMAEGKTFTPRALNKDIEAVTDKYGSQGYIDSRVAARKRPNIETGTMDLRYNVEEGEKSFIEKIEIKGNTKTKDKVIRRELSVAPGEVFDMTQVKLSKKRLEGLNYFNEQGGVDTQSEPTEIPNRKNLVVTVEERNTGNFTVGAGFSSVDSLLGFAEVSQGNFDIAKPPWFMGGGQKFRLRVQYGTRRQDYMITFIEPWFLERKLALQVDLYHRELGFVSSDDLYDERRTGARLALSRALGTENLIGTVSYTIENVGIINVDEARASQIIKDEKGNRLVSKVGASLAYDTRDNVLLPTRGQRSELSGEVAGGPFGGETDFYKLEARTAWYFKGLGEGQILELVGRTGVVEEYGDSPRVPIFDRWFLGGLYSLRGYRYRGVGPRDNTNEPIGGNTYWFAGAEYSVPIIERLRFAVFYDIGMVYGEAYDWNVKNYNDNFGFGLRLNLPIGPLRLDYGIPINDSDGVNNSHGRFQFGVGYTREF